MYSSSPGGLLRYKDVGSRWAAGNSSSPDKSLYEGGNDSMIPPRFGPLSLSKAELRFR